MTPPRTRSTDATRDVVVGSASTAFRDVTRDKSCGTSFVLIRDVEQVTRLERHRAGGAIADPLSGDGHPWVRPSERTHPRPLGRVEARCAVGTTLNRGRRRNPGGSRVVPQNLLRG